MKIDTRAFAIAFTLLMVGIILAITVWTRLSSQFGREFMDVFNSVHPHPFRATREGLSLAEEAYGSGLDVFYTLVDSLIFSLSFGLLYNRLARSNEQKEPETDA